MTATEAMNLIEAAKRNEPVSLDTLDSLSRKDAEAVLHHYGFTATKSESRKVLVSRIKSAVNFWATSARQLQVIRSLPSDSLGGFLS